MDTFFLFISQNLIAVALLLFTIVALIIYEGRKGGTKLDPTQATRMMNKEGALVVDLRPLTEFSSGHIAGSINVQPDKVEQHLVSIKHSKETPVILVCKTGSNSKGTGGSLVKAGYLKVNVINGGMMTWESNGMPLSK
ncbi:MAG: rhodanese-like domain-containing protein [SAR86 cluster bacterium]|jgi:rhodanese-related sulfurtransferase|nr:rhodanese-like domain-containing protein [SAR86 cluster bacterium]